MLGWCEKILQNQVSCGYEVIPTVVCRYRTKCSTIMVIKEVEEDYPDCKVEMVKSCSNSVNPGEACPKVEVKRCRIVKRIVRKAQPDTRCTRVPSKTCVKKKCQVGKEKCEEGVRVLEEFQPEESCTFLPRRVCQRGCRSIVKRVCEEIQGGVIKTRLVCNGTIIDTP